MPSIVTFDAAIAAHTQQCPLSGAKFLVDYVWKYVLYVRSVCPVSATKHYPVSVAMIPGYVAETYEIVTYRMVSKLLANPSLGSNLTLKKCHAGLAIRWRKLINEDHEVILSRQLSPVNYFHPHTTRGPPKRPPR